MHTSASRSKKPVGVFFTSKKILLMCLKKKRCSGSPSCSKQNALKDHIEKKMFFYYQIVPQKRQKKIKYADDMLFFQFELLTLFVTTAH